MERVSPGLRSEARRGTAASPTWCECSDRRALPVSRPARRLQEGSGRPCALAPKGEAAVVRPPERLLEAAAGLPPLFLFQEGTDPKAGLVFRELAGLTKGAFVRFDSNAPRELAELLRTVAAFATGGIRALTDLRTEGARRLLTRETKPPIV